MPSKIFPAFTASDNYVLIPLVTHFAILPLKSPDRRIGRGRLSPRLGQLRQAAQEQSELKALYYTAIAAANLEVVRP